MTEISFFAQLETINARPAPFQVYTAEALWTDEHTSKKMLEYHLDGAVDLSSRKEDFIHRSVQWIVSHFEVDQTKRIADFGCGPGLYTTRFAETGADVTGIDFSERSIQYAGAVAERRGLDITYLQENYLEFETDRRFDLITMIFCDYCALGPAQRRTLLDKYHSFLKPGGAVLLDVHSLNTFDAREEVASYERNQLDGFWSPRDYYGFLNTFKYDEEKVTLDKYTIIEETRTRVVYNWLQYFSRNSLAEEFERGGFEVEAFYSDVGGSTFSPDSPDLAMVARRRGAGERMGKESE
jgi:SAM-dependent methyltransferase